MWWTPRYPHPHFVFPFFFAKIIMDDESDLEAALALIARLRSERDEANGRSEQLRLRTLELQEVSKKKGVRERGEGEGTEEREKKRREKSKKI